MRTFSQLCKAGAAAGALTLTMALAPGAGAAPSEQASDRAFEVHQATTTEAQRQAIRDYWTPARMEAATPRGLMPTAKPDNPGKGKPGGGGGGGGDSAKAVRADETPEFGKVFFTLGGSNYVCSGTATSSTNGDVVTTAGHCLNEGPGDYATRFMFVPAYLDGEAPYGEWVAEKLLTTSQWANGGDFNHDVGFAVMAEQGGQSLTEVTGSYPIAFDLGYNLTFEAYGYPAAKPYDGSELWKCSGTAGVDSRGTDDHRLPCSMTGGSSGGGWITDGQLNSVNSFGYRGEKDVMYGPYFGDVERTVFQAAQNS